VNAKQCSEHVAAEEGPTITELPCSVQPCFLTFPSGRQLAGPALRVGTVMPDLLASVRRIFLGY
jgi:hypothetical protein